MQVGLHFDSSNSKQMEISATIQNGFTISYSGIPLRPLALFIVMFPLSQTKFYAFLIKTYDKLLDH